MHYLKEAGIIFILYFSFILPGNAVVQGAQIVIPSTMLHNSKQEDLIGALSTLDNIDDTLALTEITNAMKKSGFTQVYFTPTVGFTGYYTYVLEETQKIIQGNLSNRAIIYNSLKAEIILVVVGVLALTLSVYLSVNQKILKRLYRKERRKRRRFKRAIL